MGLPGSQEALTSLTHSRTDMRRHMMCEFAAEQGAAGTVLNACDALAGLIGASCTQNRRSSTGLATQTRCSTWSRGVALEKCGPLDPQSFTLASLLGHSEETTRLRVTADWAIMLRGAAVRTP